MVTKYPTYGRGTILYGETGSSEPVHVNSEPSSKTEPLSSRWSIGTGEASRVIPPAHLRDSQQRIVSFYGLQDNWDGQGAAAVELSTVNRAIETLWDLANRAAENGRDLPTPVVGLSPDGAIGFEWSSAPAYAAVECLDNSRSVYVRINDKETERTVRSTGELWNLVREALILIPDESPVTV